MIEQTMAYRVNGILYLTRKDAEIAEVIQDFNKERSRGTIQHKKASSG